MCLSSCQVNVVEGLKHFESLLDDSEVPKLVSLVNELRAAGKRGQFQGKFTKCIFLFCTLEEERNFHVVSFSNCTCDFQMIHLLPLKIWNKFHHVGFKILNRHNPFPCMF